MDSKILDKEFRGHLYKTLTEAGYDKKEAQKIVGVKYYDALKCSLFEKMDSVKSKIESDELDVSFSELDTEMAELKKVKEMI